jgi:hypothetical protein
MKPTSKTAAQIKALARKHSRAAIKTLAAIMNQADGPATARVSAAQALLDRGWGKAAQPIAGDEDGLPVLARIERVIIEPPKQEHTNSSGEDDAFGLMCIAYEEPERAKAETQTEPVEGGWMG